MDSKKKKNWVYHFIPINKYIFKEKGRIPSPLEERKNGEQKKDGTYRWLDISTRETESNCNSIAILIAQSLHTDPRGKLVSGNEHWTQGQTSDNSSKQETDTTR